jgi:hypothetical protein
MRVSLKQKMNFSALVFDHLCLNSTQELPEKKMTYPRFLQIILNWLIRDLPPYGKPYPLSDMGKRSMPLHVSEPWRPLLEDMYIAERWQVIKKMCEY